MEDVEKEKTPDNRIPRGGGGEESEGEVDETKASGWLCSQQQQLVRAQLEFDSLVRKRTQLFQPST